MSSLKIVALLVLIVAISLAEAYPRLLVIDDGQIEAPQRMRVSRDEKFPAASIADASPGKDYKGRVGPVYTFVKTDPKANFKWGVRHRVGTQYGR